MPGLKPATPLQDTHGAAGGRGGGAGEAGSSPAISGTLSHILMFFSILNGCLAEDTEDILKLNFSCVVSKDTAMPSREGYKYGLLSDVSDTLPPSLVQLHIQMALWVTTTTALVCKAAGHLRPSYKHPAN